MDKSKLFADMQAELTGRLYSLEDYLGAGLAALAGGRAGERVSAMTEAQITFDSSPLWRELERVFCYSVHGERTEVHPLQNSTLGDALLADLITHRLPTTVVDLIIMAEARHVLDGGVREFLYADHPPPGYVSLYEIGLLADMGKHSVLNAAVPSSTDRLATTRIGKTSYVAADEARRWLAGRKGFRPTREVASDQPTSVFMKLPGPLLNRMEARAREAGLSVEDLLVRQFG
jgi:hypothetical protein